jgi:hypothetical protein
MAKLPDMPDADMMLLDRHLSRALSPEEAAAFARRLADDPALASKLADQQAVVDSLRRSIILPPADLARAQLASAMAAVASSDARVHSASDAGRRRPLHRRAPLIAAFALLLLLVGVASWQGLIFSRASAPDSASPLARLIADGFRPSIAIADRAELELTLAQKLGRRVTLPDDGSIKYLGLRSDVAASPLGVGLLALVGDQQVVLIFDLTDAATPALAPADPSLSDIRHARDADGVRLTEWSRSRSPLLLEKVTLSLR